MELSAVQHLKHKISHWYHTRSQYISLFTRMALHSCLHCLPLTKQKIWQLVNLECFAFTSNKQQSFKSVREQGWLLERDSKNVLKVISKVPEVQGLKQKGKEKQPIIILWSGKRCNEMKKHYSNKLTNEKKKMGAELSRSTFWMYLFATEGELS